MKLRRAMVTAAATAAIAPLALLSAPVAFASDSSPSAPVSSPAADESSPATSVSPTDTASVSSSPTDTASTSSSPTDTASASNTPTDQPTDSAEPTDEPTEPSGICEDNPDYKSKLDAQLTGLPGKIAVGSGWHPFTLTVKNPTKTSAKDVVFYAGVGPNDETAQDAFKSSQVQLQVKYEGAWEDVTDGAGHSVGYLDLSDIEGGQTLNYQLRLNVKASAPVGEGLTIGGGVYFDEEESCLSAGEAHYVIQIVKAGSDTGGTKPQEGGKAPVPTEKPNKNNTQEVTGNLAETGSSSALPTIGLVGGLAVAVGAGALFVVRRRKGAGPDAAA
ncbi:LAETG motif-containing sortase-dependent surface protein [Streptomyces sp. NPDC007264]|uniref:LAETG motif-containing sortase-dependent surface protein n=1 Tax=Streptomyces sp. NPDC007264 TaxID=3364777 RepID=UPI0036DEAC78